MIQQPEFKGNTETFEMSRYIDINIYHEVERTHPFYLEMVEEIHKQVSKHCQGRTALRALELGAGTGLLTEELTRHDGLGVAALEIDHECLKVLKSVVDESVNCIAGDAITYCEPAAYDILLSSFAHDHIHYDKRFAFAANIRKNLKKGGIYIMGGEILPFYFTPEQRREALLKYHGFIVDKAIRDGNYMVAQIEINALKSGIEMIGDFKRHEKLFEDEMLSTDFRLKEKIKVGPVELNDVGGVFVYVFEAI